jgi:membrane fusion protein, multidrug efflux system
MSAIETPPMDVLSTPTRRTRRLVLVALLVAIAGLLYGGYWWSYDRFYVRTDNAYVVGNLVPIVAQASGIVTQVLAEETQFVNKGDLVIRLDEHQASAALGRARGHLGETVRRITSLFIRQRQVEEKLSARSARLDLVRHDIARYREASPRGAVSKQILQNALDHLRAVEAEVRETQAEYDALNAEVGGTSVMEHPAVELAKHEFIEAHLEYERQQIKAPVSGYVAKRKGQVGDRVKPGAALMVIVPLEHLWVEANLRETELRDVRPGQSATVTVDLHGRKQTYHGTVEGLVPGTGSAFALLPPDNATGNFIHIVERVPVRIALPIEEIRKYPLRPGLSTVTQIDVSAVGQSVWSSLATVSTEEYQTDVYADELTTAGSLAEDVILSNVVSKEHRVKAEQWRENHLATLVPLERRPKDRANRPDIVPAAEATMERHARQPEVEQRVDMAVIE